MRLLWLAALCAALGIGCLLTPWHIAMTGVCLLLLAGVIALIALAASYGWDSSYYGYDGGCWT